MPQQRLTTITLCMGSSCFSRGNNRNLEVVQNFLQANNLDASVITRGHLCEGMCQQGPNLTIDGAQYRQVDPITLVGLLNHHCPKPTE